MADDGKQATKTDGGKAREERQENPGGAAGDGIAPVASDGGGDGSGRSREGSDGGEEEAAAAAVATAQELPQANPRSSSRTPFTDLSQERAYMMLTLNNDGSDYGSWEGGSYIPEEDDDFEDPDDETDDEDNDVEGSYDGTDMDDEDAFHVHPRAFKIRDFVVDDPEDANGGSNQAAELESENFSIGVSNMDRPNRLRPFNIHAFKSDDEDASDVHAAEDANGGSNQAAELESENFSIGVSNMDRPNRLRPFNIHAFKSDDEDASDVHAAEDANGGSNQAAELESENFSIGVSNMDRPNRLQPFNIHAFKSDDEDASDVHAAEDANGGSNQAAELEESDTFSIGDAEERAMEARMLALAGLNDRVVEEEEDPHDSQDTWEDVDPDELSYEELIALGDVVGIESRGLSADTIASLSSVSYKTGSSQNGTNDSCVICRLDYEDGEMLTVLSCKHSYHSECINNWLLINKVCPVCSAEVSGSANS